MQSLQEITDVLAVFSAAIELEDQLGDHSHMA
jgi:hypothetical protein